jgi:hypothetical protein
VSNTRTPSVTPSSTLPLGECWSVYNPDQTNNIYVQYTDRSGNTSACAVVGPDSTSIICIKPATSTSITAYDSGCGTGSTVTVIKTYLGTSCVDATSCTLPASNSFTLCGSSINCQTACDASP